MPELLRLEGLRAGYGEAVVLGGISLTLNEGESLALLGRNGMGKTTLVNSIVGVTRYRGGAIRLDGRDITRMRPDQRAHAGIGWVPQERNIFKSLTVEENLTAVARPGAWTPARVYELFPRLAERRRQPGGTLSGGEQQMLAIGRAMMNFPKLLMLDEPSLGLSPVLAELVFERLADIRRQGLTILLVEQNSTCLEMASGGIILANGRVVLAGDRLALEDSEFVRRAYLGV